MPKFPGEDLVNSYYPILFALILGLILGFRFVSRVCIILAGMTEVTTDTTATDTTAPVLITYDSVTRGNKYKLFKHSFRHDIRKFSFTCRIVNIWNSLPN